MIEPFGMSTGSREQLTILMLALLFMFLLLIGMAEMFRKAGQPGWTAYVPIYNAFVLMRISGCPSWWMALLLVPGLNVVIWFLIHYRLSHHFGRGTLTAVVLTVCPLLGYTFLGLGSTRYFQAPARGIDPELLSVAETVATPSVSRG